VQVGGRWRNARGELLDAGELRASLPADVPPGGSTGVYLQVRVPRQSGRHWLEVDLVQEGVAWFAERGSQPARMEVLAGGAAAEAGPLPFRERHPGLHRALTGLGVVRAVSLVRSLRRSWRELEVAKLLPRAADMDMHAVPKAEMLELLQAAGGSVLRTEPLEMVRSAWQTYRYWVTRSSPLLPLPPASAWRRPLGASLEAAYGGGELCLGPGAPAAVRLRLANTGGVTWPLYSEPWPGAILLGAHAYRGGELVSLDYLRQALPQEVRPDQSIEFNCPIVAPGDPGSYVIRFDLVLEGVCWFELHGTRPLDIALRVTSTS
jgi:hypothetical protein